MGEAEVYGRASQTIRIAMGTRTMGQGRGVTRIWLADEDPLAWWLGVEAVVSLAREEDCPGHVASEADSKVCARCGVHIDSLRPDEPA